VTAPYSADPSMTVTYYYNASTGESSYTAPPGFAG
jgi:hypothetical protein